MDSKMRGTSEPGRCAAKEKVDQENRKGNVRGQIPGCSSELIRGVCEDGKRKADNAVDSKFCCLK